MTDTVAVLALDAADHELAQRWDCDNLLLEQHGRLQTFSHSRDKPYTPEVWATVATGVGPEKHGIGEDRQGVQWDNPALRAASRVTRHLPDRYRRALGRPFRHNGFDRTGQRIDESVDHPFDAALSWPGISELEHLETMWLTLNGVLKRGLSQAAARETMQGLTGQEIGYLAAMADTDRALVGAHAHVLDITGHMYAEHPDEYREWYEWVDRQVGRLRDNVDRLVVLSDHGMQTTALDDDEPGNHSWRPFIATQGIDGPLPDDVHDVRDYLEDWAGDSADAADGRVSVDTPTETLEQLGYLES